MAPTDDLSQSAVELMKQLLALHYVSGGVSLQLIALVEDELKSVGQWFPDPQYTFHETQGYM